MATSARWNENDNCFRSLKLLLEGGQYLLKELLMQEGVVECDLKTVDELLAVTQHKTRLNNLIPRVVNEFQFEILYPKNRSATDLSKWDITLTTLVLTNCVTLTQTQTNELADIRTLHNTLYAHVTSMYLSKTEFQTMWTDITSTLRRVSKHLSVQCQQKFEEMLLTIKNEALAPDWESKRNEMYDTLKRGLVDIENMIPGLKIHEARPRIVEKTETEELTEDDMIELIRQIQQNVRVDRTELNRNIEQAHTRLQSHGKDLERFGLEYKTKITDDITNELFQNKLVILTGIPGIGKTHIALNSMMHILKIHPELQPLIMREPRDIEKMLDPCSSFVLLVDDIFGPVNLDSKEVSQWNEYIDTFIAHVDDAKLLTIITLRKTIFSACSVEIMAKLLKRFKVFHLGENPIYRDEMEGIFKSYSKSHNESHKASAIENICQVTQVGIGFPLLCRIMKGHDVAKLFARPVYYIKHDILTLKQHQTPRFIALLMTLFFGNKLSKIGFSQDQTFCFNEVTDYFKSSALDKHTVFMEAEALDNTYLKYNEQKMHFTFLHDAISESTFEVARESIPGILIQFCPLGYLVKLFRPSLINTPACSSKTNETPETIYYNTFHGQILDRFKTSIALQTSSENLQFIAGSPFWLDTEFVDIAFRKLLFSDFLACDSHGLSIMCYFARLGFIRLIQRIISLGKVSNYSSDIFEEQIQKATIEACMSAKCDCVNYCLTHLDTITDEMIFAAVKGGDKQILHFLLGRYTSNKTKTVLTIQCEGKSLLLVACEHDKEQVIKYLCESCIELTKMTDDKNNNAAHYAARNGSKPCLIYLLGLGINPRAITDTGETLLHLASLGGHIETVTYICDTFQDIVNLTDNDGNTASHYAAISGSIECLTHVILHGVDPLTQTKFGYTILHEAAKAGNTNVLGYICKYFPSLLHVTDHTHCNSAHWAAYGGNIDCLKLLILQGINTHGKTSGGLTLLHFAALAGHTPVAKYLSEIFPDMLYNDSPYVAHIAALGTVECLKYIIDKGIDPYDETHLGETLLHKAALIGNISVVKYLCETYEDMLHMTDYESRNAAHKAAHDGSVECLQYLIVQGINPNDKTRTGDTLLHMAALGGNITVVKYICETYEDMLHMTDYESRNAAHNAAHKGPVECLKYLIDQGINPNDKTRTGDTLLHMAALGGNITVVKYICETYEDMLHMTDYESRNAAHHAAQKGSVECLKYLIDQGINPNDKTRTGDTVLHRAALGSNITVVKYICETYEDMLHMTDYESRNAAHNAAHKSSVQCLKYLIDQGINPNDKTHTGDTVLHRAALGGNITVVKYLCETYEDMLHMTDYDSRNAAHNAAYTDSLECLKYLIDQGINPNDKTRAGGTLLHFAALGGNITVVKYLCETYKDMLHMTDYDSRNAAHNAAHTGSVECLIYLIEQGINPNDKTVTGDTLLHIAALGDNITVVKYLCEMYGDMLHMTNYDTRNAAHNAAHKGPVECLKYLIEQGINPNDKTRTGDTLLHIAALGGNTTVVKYLCETYEDMLHMTDYDSRNAAHNAAHKGSVECLKYLIDQGINPNNKTRTGNTLLHIAALDDNITVVKYICETYEDMLHMTDYESRNAAHHAAQKGSVECLKYLIDQGINPNDKTRTGDTLLHIATLGDNLAVKQYLCDNYPNMLKRIYSTSKSSPTHASESGHKIRKLE